MGRFGTMIQAQSWIFRLKLPGGALLVSFPILTPHYSVAAETGTSSASSISPGADNNSSLLDLGVTAQRGTYVVNPAIGTDDGTV